MPQGKSYYKKALKGLSHNQSYDFLTYSQYRLTLHKHGFINLVKGINVKNIPSCNTLHTDNCLPNMCLLCKAFGTKVDAFSKFLISIRISFSLLFSVISLTSSHICLNCGPPSLRMA